MGSLSQGPQLFPGHRGHLFYTDHTPGPEHKGGGPHRPLPPPSQRRERVGARQGRGTRVGDSPRELWAARVWHLCVFWLCLPQGLREDSSEVTVRQPPRTHRRQALPCGAATACLCCCHFSHWVPCTGLRPILATEAQFRAARQHSVNRALYKQAHRGQRGCKASPKFHSQDRDAGPSDSTVVAGHSWFGLVQYRASFHRFTVRLGVNCPTTFLNAGVFVCKMTVTQTPACAAVARIGCDPGVWEPLGYLLQCCGLNRVPPNSYAEVLSPGNAASFGNAVTADVMG